MKTGSASQTKRTVLCADIGSSSLKTALIDEKGSVLAYDRCRFNRNSPSSMWYDALCSSVARISRMTSLNSLAALSISGNGPTIAFLYESGLTDIVMWNDGRYQNRVLSYTGTSLFLPRIISYRNSIDHKEGKLVSLLS
ncbi:MAG: hypothetical protein GXY14_01115, partial [Spirochaetes bacterium]|nr:hypothetical protein [Spirochaetota bacterium]